MSVFSKQYRERIPHQERLALDMRIHNQRARLRWWEALFHQHVQATILHTPKGFRWRDFAMRLVQENRELRARLGEPTKGVGYCVREKSDGTLAIGLEVRAHRTTRKEAA